MRGYWPIRTSALSEQEIAGIRIVTKGSTELCGVRKAIQQAIVCETERESSRWPSWTGRPSPVTRRAVLVITFTPSLTVRSLGQRQIKKVSTNRASGTTDDQAEYEATIGLREARKKLPHGTNIETVLQKCDHSRASVTPNGSKYIQELEKVTTCRRRGALGHWEDESPQKGHRRRSSPSDRSSGSGRFRKQIELKKEVTKRQKQGERKRSESQVWGGHSDSWGVPLVIQSKEHLTWMFLLVGQCWTAARHSRRSSAVRQVGLKLARNVVVKQEMIAGCRLWKEVPFSWKRSTSNHIGSSLYKSLELSVDQMHIMYTGTPHTCFFSCT